MQRDIKIGEETIPMRATAGTAYRYRQVFGGDLLQVLIKSAEDAVTNAETIETIQRLGYIMAASAEGKDMNSLNEDGYIDWLDQFDAGDLIEALPSIMNTYIRNKETKTTPKKRGAEQSAQ